MKDDDIMIFVVYDRAIDEEIGDVLNRMDITYYTKWKDVVGVGRHDPHLGTPVWPGLNNALMIVTHREKKEEFLNLIRTVGSQFTAAGLRVFVLPVLEMV
jgi:hypothetical protein